MNKLISIFIPLILLIFVILFGVNTLKQTNFKKTETIDSLSLKVIKADSLENHVFDHLPFGMPLDTIDISSNFGKRRNPKHGRWEFHPGLDLKGLPFDTVYATGSGIISVSGNCGGYGRCVVIDHIDGIKSRYAHMTKIFKRKNKMIEKGEPIGTVGKTGYATGYHLHYEIVKNEQYLDPLKWIKVENDLNIE